MPRRARKIVGGDGMGRSVLRSRKVGGERRGGRWGCCDGVEWGACGRGAACCRCTCEGWIDGSPVRVGWSAAGRLPGRAGGGRGASRFSTEPDANPFSRRALAIEQSALRGRPYGGEAWQHKVAKQLELEYTLRARGRPKKPQRELESESGTNGWEKVCVLLSR
jgi:hypothetical protein